MAITPTSLLSLPIITTGTESGTWGLDVNNGLTSYLDIAIAGTLSLTQSSFTANALTLANTAGASGGTNISSTTAQYAILSISSLTANVTITAPSSSKTYYVINGSSYTVTIKASGQSGVTIPAGLKAIVVFDGSDYKVAASYLPTVTVTTATIGTGNLSTLSTDGTGTVTFGGTGAVTLPSGTTAQEPGTPSTGMIRFNTTLSQFEGYNGTLWGGIGGANASGCIYVNNQTITSNYTFQSNTSGSSTGPITIASGVSVTVGATSRWAIL